MSFETATAFARGHDVRTDVCIVGGGAAGLTLACELDRSGLDVVVLEAGGFGADLDTEADTFSFDELGTPLRNPIPNRARRYGGSTGLWFGRVAAPGDTDLDRRSWVPDSGWPISRAELDPWIDLAARRLGVAFPDKLGIDAWERTPEIDALRSSPLIDLAVFLWAGASDVGQSSRATLERSRNIRVVTRATVVRLETDGARHIEKVSALGPGDRDFTVTARHVVLASGGLENARLLLASNDRHPAGLGNQNDNVGRYYLDHPRSENLARVDARELTDHQIAVLTLLHERFPGPYGPAQLRVEFDRTVRRTEGLLNHSAHGHLVSDGEQSVGHRRFTQLRNLIRARRFTGPGDLARRAGGVVAAGPDLIRLAAARATGRNRPTDFFVVDQLEQVPDRNSRVTVDGRRRDRFGLPRLQLDWRIDSSTLVSHRRLHEVLRDTFRQIGITTFRSVLLDDPDHEPDYLDMKHASGTTRMSETAETGVVDADGLVFGTDNLYVLGSSTFPTSGNFNPTLTIVALAARMARHLRSL